MMKKIIKWFIIEIIFTLIAIACYSCYSMFHSKHGWYGNVVPAVIVPPDFKADFILNSFRYSAFLFLLSLLSIILSLIFLIIFRKSDKKQKIKNWLFFSFANFILALVVSIIIPIFVPSFHFIFFD